MFREFIADDRAGVGDKGFDDIFLEGECEVEVRPGLVAVFEHGEAEDEVVQVFEVALAAAFVAEAEDHAGDLHVC
jgi:hypothetical protein